eukprot:15069005-Alexandrium_andersonii.AAC.1
MPRAGQGGHRGRVHACQHRPARAICFAANAISAEKGSGVRRAARGLCSVSYTHLRAHETSAHL